MSEESIPSLFGDNIDDDADYNSKQDDSASNDSSEEGGVQEGGGAEGALEPPAKRRKHPGVGYKTRAAESYTNFCVTNYSNCFVPSMDLVRYGLMFSMRRIKLRLWINMSTTMVRKRTAMRAVFSKSYKLLDLLNEENPDVISIETHFRVLKDRQNELRNVDQEKYDNLLLDEEQGSEDALIKEMESVDKYNLKYYELRAHVDRLKHKTSVSEYTVRDVLQNRFGRKDLFIEYYTREMLKLVVDNQGMQLSTLHDRLETQLRALESLRVAADNYAAILFPLIESCLPVEILKNWQRSTSILTKTLKKQMDSLMTFLKAEIEGEEHVSLTHSKPERDNLKVAKRNVKFKIEEPPKPTACSKDEPGSEETNLDRRKQILSNAKRCFACAKTWHSAQKCTAKCVICQGRHIPLLCPKVGGEWSSEGKRRPMLKLKTENKLLLPSTVNSLTVHCNSQAYLQTLTVYVRNGDIVRKARTLIYSGSQCAYISDNLVKEIEYLPLREESILHSLFGGSSIGLTKHKCFQVQLVSLNHDNTRYFETLKQKIIAATIPSVTVDCTMVDELHNHTIQLAKDSDSLVELLMGADIADKLWTGRRNVLSLGLIVMETVFGWTVMGKRNVSEITEHNTFKRHTSRYCGPMEAKDYRNHLPTNRELALGRVNRTTKKLSMNKGLFSDYSLILESWLSEEIIEEAKDKKELYLIELIPAILCKFREKSIGLAADIKKAFLQISLHPDDCDYLKFFWWKENHPEVLRHTRVVFGITSSPFLLGTVQDFHLTHFEKISDDISTALSMAQRIFDPIGTTIPATFYLKLLVQCLWEQKVDWDKTLKDDMQRPFENWLRSIPRLKEICINRFFGKQTKTSVNIFCNASCKAYAAVIFVCCEYNGKVKLELLQAKARVAPLKGLTVSLLELLATTIGTRLAKAVLDNLEWTDIPIYFWTDSTTVIAWIQRQEEWSVFVRNQIKEVRELTKPSDIFRDNLTLLTCLLEKLKKTSQLSLEEVERAEQTVVRLVQEELFVSPVDDQPSALQPFKDSHGLIWLNTKITEQKKRYSCIQDISGSANKASCCGTQQIGSFNFAINDNTKRNSKRGVFVPNDWTDIIVQSNRKFFAKNMIDDNFFALDEIQPLFVKSVTGIQNMQWLQYRKNEPWTLFYKTTFFEDMPFSKYSMLTKTITGRVPKELPSLMSKRNKKKVKVAKHKDLLDLLHFVSPVHHTFYRSLDYKGKP
ncbi:hypothetical protein PR048_004992 [Dryococelus australis]|uniref:Peptidase aspartic putative domain-containing protein n=1 Tax=Dryococelus australis TaxID=614101 RepID=A0ABQ9I6Y6_9NEOP|nr:hypothetical protein PR048_004992 [Dryococelus australis]